MWCSVGEVETGRYWVSGGADPLFGCGSDTLVKHHDRGNGTSAM